MWEIILSVLNSGQINFQAFDSFRISYIRYIFNVMSYKSLDEMYDPEFYSGETHEGVPVMELWVSEMLARYSSENRGEFRWSVNSSKKVGVVLHSMCYRSSNIVNKKCKSKRTLALRRKFDEERYYRGFHFIRQAVSGFFARFPDHSVLVDLADSRHNAAVYVYRRDGVNNYIAFNCNWDEIFQQFIHFITMMSPTIHGFYLICREGGNSDERCRKYTYDFIRDVMSGKLDPKTVKKTHWYCLRRRKRIYNRLTFADEFYFYPTSNVRVKHGVNSKNEPCGMIDDSGFCNGCDFRTLYGSRYDTVHCAVCEGDEETSPMYRPL